jgi:hypothetical protein
MRSRKLFCAVISMLALAIPTLARARRLRRKQCCIVLIPPTTGRMFPRSLWCLIPQGISTARRTLAGSTMEGLYMWLLPK